MPGAFGSRSNSAGGPAGLYKYCIGARGQTKRRHFQGCEGSDGLLQVECPAVFLVVLQVAGLPVHIGGGRLLPTSPKEGQTHQLAQVTLAHLVVRYY